MPFIMGIEHSMFDFAVEYLEENQNIFLVFIEDQNINISNNIHHIIKSKQKCEKTKKIQKKTVFNDLLLLINLPRFPKENYEHIKNQLENLVSSIKKNNIINNNVSY